VHRRVIAGAAALALLAAGGAGIAMASGSNAASGGAGGGSRLDDGKDLLGQARISESQAIAAAQRAASGALNEVDLEHDSGRLVFNVDVGSKDVKVDAANGSVLRASSDD
jgi:uncharacterized membrane protein YkoI